VLGLSPNVAVKIGSAIDYDHISTVEYINEHAPDVPTPAVYGVLKTDTRTYLFMTRINGVSLDKLWPALDEAQKTSIRDQLTPIFKQLRAIPRPPLEDGKFTLGGGRPRRCKDMRRQERIASYPIGSEEEFNDFLLDTGGRKTLVTRAKMIRSFLRSDHRIVMTHGDLHPRNIMAVMEPAEEVLGRVAAETRTSRVRVVGLIDWETSGWYPEYWEYTKALNTVFPGCAMEDWWAYIPIDAIGRWPGEYAIDVMVSRYVD
jgi:aminoglycoside phosphotransferase (APT) family kinase protein